MNGIVRIGAGAGFSGDRIEPAVALAAHGNLDYLVFECLAERTIAHAVRERRQNPDAGFDPYLEERWEAVLPAARANRVRIITNMGAANPIAAARHTARVARRLGLGSLRIAAVTGDDVLASFVSSPVAAAISSRMISANAYLGCEPIVAALKQGADIVLTGRAADPSLFVAPLVHELDWALDDWERLGRGTVIGHLLECAGQVTGGYFADPGYKEVHALATLGFPIAEVSADGSACITKLAQSGGGVSVATCTEQLLYELHDPSRYLTPDVIADFSGVRFTQRGPDRVSVEGGSGRERPPTLKVSVGYEEGYAAEGQISYAGPGAVARGRLALAIVRERLHERAGEFLDLRFELIGVDSVFPGSSASGAPSEVRARVAGRSLSLSSAQRIGREVEALYTNGPAGGGGATQSVRAVVGIESATIAREQVQTQIHWETVP